MVRFCWLIVGSLWLAGGAAAQERMFHAQWYYHTNGPTYMHMSHGHHHGGWHHFGPPRFDGRKKAAIPTATISDSEAIDALRKLLDRLERGQRHETTSALERARAEVHAAEAHLAAAKANLAHAEGKKIALPRMIVRPQPPATPAPTDLEQRLDRLHREIEELRRDLRRSREEE